jgi:hypothetical protein
MGTYTDLIGHVIKYVEKACFAVYLYVIVLRLVFSSVNSVEKFMLGLKECAARIYVLECTSV